MDPDVAPPPPLQLRRASAALLLSGAAGLLQEMVWNRLWVQVFGSTAASTSTVLAVFMLGMGLGGRLAPTLGRWLGASGRSLYRRLELALAAAALLAPVLLGLADAVHLAAARTLGLDAALLPWLRALLALGALLPPAILMGASLPALAQALPVSDAPDAEAAAGRLYAANTAGGVLGILAAAFLLLPHLGIAATTLAAAACSLAAAGLVGPGELATPPVAASRTPEAATPDPTALPRALYAFVGFWALALEVLFSRVVLAAAGASTYAFAAVLSAFLGGIALGSWGAAALLPVRGSPLRALAIRLAALAGVLVATSLTLPHYDYLYLRAALLATGPFSADLGTWALATLLLLPTGLALGAFFPAATRALLPLGTTSEAMGSAYFVNSLGGALGALTAYHLILPTAGLTGGILAAASASALAATWLLRREGAGILALLCVGLLAATPLLISGTVHTRIDRTAYRYLTIPEEHRPPLWEWLEPKRLVWYQDGPDASVSVTAQPRKKNLALRINGKTDASLLGDLASQLALGVVPVLFQEPLGDVLLIGLGGGATAQALLLHPYRRLDIAELSPTVARAARAMFSPFFPLPFQDPRSTIHLADGRLLVRAWPERVDLLVSEPTNLFVQGVSHLYTLEFFRDARARLHSSGVFVCWLQTYAIPEDAVRRVARTLLQVFPHVTLTWHQDLFFIASDRPLRYDWERLTGLLARREIASSLRTAGIHPTPEELLSGYLASEAALRSWSKDAPLLTDDHPALEYLTAPARFRPTRPDLLRSVALLRHQSAYSDTLPIDGLLETHESGALFLAARLRVPAHAKATAQVHRREVPAPEGAPLTPQASTLLYPTWSQSTAQGSHLVQAWPTSALPDPRTVHARFQALARSAGASIGPAQEAQVFDHPATWSLFPGVPGQPARAVLTWGCPVTERSYVVTAIAAEDGDHQALLEGLLPDLSCVHPGRDGAPTFGRGSLGAPGS